MDNSEWDTIWGYCSRCGYEIFEAEDGTIENGKKMHKDCKKL